LMSIIVHYSKVQEINQACHRPKEWLWESL
jgi:hypothetical protein